MSLDGLFVTGGCGFIGSNFITYFCKQYPEIPVYNYDALYYSGNIENIDETVRFSKNYHFIQGNLQDIQKLKFLFQKETISHVIHFAAQSHVQSSFDDSLQYTYDNVVGTHTLLEVNRLYNPHLQKFIHVSTDEVYGESSMNSSESKQETSLLCPTNPYAATKAAAEMLAQSYYHSFNLPILITRSNNVYGPNQYPEKLIPRFIQLLKDNKPVTIQGEGTCLRSFLHVNDSSRAFDLLVRKGKIGEIYNIGCSNELSVLKIAQLLIEKIQNTTEYSSWIEYISDRPFNDKRYFINSDKLETLGWSPQESFLEKLYELCDD